jgi:hypothetical protein
LQLPGITKKSINQLTNQFGGDGSNLLWELRSLPRGESGELLRKIKTNQHASTLNSLYSIPKIAVKQAQVIHRIDKATVKSRGSLRIKIEIDREKNKKSMGKQGDAPIIIGLVLGSYTERILLAYSEITIGRSGKWSIEKELEFDWNLARGDCGEDVPKRKIILRLLLDTIRGLDSEIAINLIEP